MISRILVRRDVLFERWRDYRRIIRDRIERKHVAQKPQESNMVIPLEAIDRSRGFVGKIDVRRFEFVLQDALKIDELIGVWRIPSRTTAQCRVLVGNLENALVDSFSVFLHVDLAYRLASR